MSHDDPNSIGATSPAGSPDPTEVPAPTEALDRAVERTREARRAASQRRRKQAASLGLRIHVTVYVLVQLLLIVIWALTSDGGQPWFLYPLVGWGIGLALHALAVRTRLFSLTPANPSSPDRKATT
jgi:hypothetical protein